MGEMITELEVVATLANEKLELGKLLSGSGNF